MISRHRKQIMKITLPKKKPVGQTVLLEFQKRSAADPQIMLLAPMDLLVVNAPPLPTFIRLNPAPIERHHGSVKGGGVSGAHRTERNASAWSSTARRQPSRR